MDNWYCHVGGQRYGPLRFEDMQAWCREGRIKPEDLVWNEGMTDWAKAGGVPGLFMPPASPSPEPPRPAGTDGHTCNAELTAWAREQLRGRWWPPIAVGLILAAIQTGSGFLPYAGGLIQLAITGPLELGVAIYFLAFARRGNPDIGVMFNGFQRFGSALGAYLLMTLFILLWSLLLIIPGIIAALAYSQTYFVMIDHPELGPLEAITRSKEMMRGYKEKLFWLGLRFFGWSLLCILTLGIGFIWLTPYMRVTYARFYDDLQPPVPEQAGTPAPPVL